MDRSVIYDTALPSCTEELKLLIFLIVEVIITRLHISRPISVKEKVNLIFITLLIVL